MTEFERDQLSDDSESTQLERIIGSGEHVAMATEDPALIFKAQRLLAQEYLRRNFITADDIDGRGVLKEEGDPYSEHSTYYVVTTNSGEDVVAAVRTISYNEKMGEHSFPLMKYKRALSCDAVDAIERTGLENIVEVSALVRDKNLDKEGTAAMQLYKRMYIDACYGDTSEKITWIMACNPALFGNFKLLFDGAMKRIGPDLPYPGQPAIPVMFPIRQGTLDIIKASRDKKNKYRGVQGGVLDYFFTGADLFGLHDDIVQAFEADGYDALLERMAVNDTLRIPGDEKMALKRIKRAAVIGKTKETLQKYRPELIAAAGLTGYTVVRTGLVAEGISPVSDVDWQTFLGIELVTTPQYVWGAGDLVRNAGNDSYPTKRKMGAYAMVASAFVAPYAYLAAEGALSSEQGAVATGGIVAIAAIQPVAKAVKKRLRSKKAQRS